MKELQMSHWEYEKLKKEFDDTIQKMREGK
jgi:hypothetical protein